MYVSYATELSGCTAFYSFRARRPGRMGGGSFGTEDVEHGEYLPQCGYQNELCNFLSDGVIGLSVKH